MSDEKRFAWTIELQRVMAEGTPGSASPIATQETVDVIARRIVTDIIPVEAIGLLAGTLGPDGIRQLLANYRSMFFVAILEALSASEKRNEELAAERSHWLGIAQQKLADLQDLAPRYEALRTENYTLKAEVEGLALKLELTTRQRDQLSEFSAGQEAHLASLTGRVGDMREKAAKVADGMTPHHFHHETAAAIRALELPAPGEPK